MEKIYTEIKQEEEKQKLRKYRNNITPYIITHEKQLHKNFIFLLCIL